MGPQNADESGGPVSTRQEYIQAGTRELLLEKGRFPVSLREWRTSYAHPFHKLIDKRMMSDNRFVQSFLGDALFQEWRVSSTIHSLIHKGFQHACKEVEGLVGRDERYPGPQINPQG